MRKQKLSPSRVAPRVLVILPNMDFIDMITEAAKRNKQSLNGEIVERLYASFGLSSTIDATRLQMLQIELDIQANTLEQLDRFMNPTQHKPIHTRWVNIYKGGSLTPAPGVYDSKEEADKGQGRIACIEISYTEGEGL